MKYGILII